MAIGKGTDEFGASFVDAVVVVDAVAAAPGAVGSTCERKGMVRQRVRLLYCA